MIHQDFRSRVGEAAWGRLRQSVVLVCRDAVGVGASLTWSQLGSALSHIGAEACLLMSEKELKQDATLAVLADFADKKVNSATVEAVKVLVQIAGEEELQTITEESARIVDRELPDQSFEFRAMLVLLSLSAQGQFEA
ncbi:hypothetical protein [Ensifer sp.]|uniref:hypothetical protein n=1 Tax=Ensifer sp. TaxID=1872086 RepID=UPI0028A189EB|nr:hypothetical protein [Ensifer sp.]